MNSKTVVAFAIIVAFLLMMCCLLSMCSMREGIEYGEKVGQMVTSSPTASVITSLL